MNAETGLTLSGRIRSFSHALAGIRFLLLSQPNARIHAAATLLVVAAGWFFEVSSAEWLVLTLVIVIVWAAEALNTAFELLCDVASPEYHPVVRTSKDVAAAAVLVCAIGSLIVGAIIFVPHLLDWLAGSRGGL